MTLPAPSGWGGGRWGSTGWGGAEVDDLRLVSATAVRENAVRLVFNYAPFFDGLLSPNDASNARRYSVVGVAGTQGLDQLPVRPVGVLFAQVADVVESAGTILDVFVDRPFSPYPAQYIVGVNNLLSFGSSLPLDPAFASIKFFGVQALFVHIRPRSHAAKRGFLRRRSSPGLQ